MSFVTASRVYYPGHLIYTEKPFARVLPRSKRNDHCEFCSKKSEDLVPCSECSIVKYCGMECRAKDSSDHGIECENMEKIKGHFYEDFVRLLSRIIFKIKDKDWTTITRNVMGTDVSFQDIDPHYEEMTQNPKFMLIYKGLKKPLKDFVGEENTPEEENLLKIIGKVKFSASNFGINLPYEFFFGMTKFKHECIPNSNLDIHRNVMKVWAIKKIPNSEQITVSHRTILSSDILRAPINDDSLDICRCTECSLPYGESVLTKILDEEKAYDVIKFTERVIRTGQILSKMDHYFKDPVYEPPLPKIPKELQERISRGEWGYLSHPYFLYMEKNPFLKVLVDKGLQMHEGVLGHTNALHLQLLATKVMILEDDDVQKKMYLIELEKHMSAALGEFYIELHDIYEGLVAVCLSSGNALSSSSLLESAFYLKKLKPLQMHRLKEE